MVGSVKESRLSHVVIDLIYKWYYKVATSNKAHIKSGETINKAHIESGETIDKSTPKKTAGIYATDHRGA
jgi:hypothetical protein